MGVIEQGEQAGSINWSDSLAYYAGYGQLWVNLLGRDPQGAVHPQGEFEEVRDTLVNALPNKLRDPKTGASVIERVYRKEELYTGNYLFCAPDLVVVFKPGYAPSPHSTYINFDETTFTTPATDTTVMAGTHPASLRGFLLAAAPTLASSVSVSGQLLAVVPTILHALGVEYTNLDGTAIREVFSPSYLETHPIHSDADNQDLSEEDEELVINRLRDLGYI
jgi:predicted AlkP superfamily phosphohydrolase/phosphomutase